MARQVVAYASAVGTTVGAVLVCFGLQAAFGRPYVTFLVVGVMLAAWMGGMGPGLFAAFLSTLALNYFFQTPRFELEVANLADGVQLVIFMTTAVLVTMLTRSRNKARLAAHHAETRAMHDVLTELPNRALLEDRLEQAVREAKREGTSAAVLLVDLNGFKAVNDTLGHAVGDQVLREVGQRLIRTIRASDTVARLGGDEFVVVLPNVPHEHHVIDVAHKLWLSVTAPFDVRAGTAAHVGASIGAALYPGDGQDPPALLTAADRMMYECKRAGLSFVSSATPEGQRFEQPAAPALRL
ncbi:MAG: diguanylate cyclase [Chloroflexi bacterium]|nr:diguanylate cyclase [Chloroflexota bacterium]